MNKSVSIPQQFLVIEVRDGRLMAQGLKDELDLFRYATLLILTRFKIKSSEWKVPYLKEEIDMILKEIMEERIDE